MTIFSRCVHSFKSQCAKPSVGFVLLVYFFPIIFGAIYIGIIGAAAHIFQMCGSYLAAIAPLEHLLSRGMIAPLIFFFVMFCMSDWFRWQSILIVLFWIFIALGATESGGASFERWACANQINDSIDFTERRSRYGYFPNRLWSWENTMLTGTLQHIEEPAICGNVPPNFVCRMLILPKDGTLACYRLDKLNSGGLVTMKRIAGNMVNLATRKVDNCTIELSPQKLDEAIGLLYDGRVDYQRNKYIDPDYRAGQSRIFLEWQLNGQYFFYTFLDEKEPNRAPLGQATPAFVVKLRQLLAE